MTKIFVTSTGPLSLRASTHGLVINIIHSLCTCAQLSFNDAVMKMLKLSLTEFSLPKFYMLFGISKVKSAAVSAFRSNYRPGDRSFAYTPPEQERMSLQSLEAVTDALLEIMEACMKELKECDWLQQWTDLAKRFAFQYNPALQPRAIIVYGCIAKSVSDSEIKQLLRILVKALESYTDLTLIEAIIMCLTRLQPLLYADSPIHYHLFWVAISVLQLDEVALYAAGLALLEQNLHTIDNMGLFDNKSLEHMMMDTRDPLEWHFKQLDHSMGLSFKMNFNFAVVGHLLKGFRHPVTNTVSRTIRVLNMLLSIVAKSSKRDKFEVTPQSVPLLAALVSVSEEVRSRCHLKHRISPHLSESASSDSLSADLISHHGPPQAISPGSHPHLVGVISPGMPPAGMVILPPMPPSVEASGGMVLSASTPIPTPRKQKSWETLDQNAMSQARQQKNTQLSQVQENLIQQQSPKVWRSLDLEPHQRPPFKTQRSSSMPTPKTQRSLDIVPPPGKGHGPVGHCNHEIKERSSRGSVSNESNILLDPDVLVDYPTQALLLTVLATLVRNTTDENEARILYEYLAEASVVFPKVFPVIHSLLDGKINSALSLCHDQATLNAVQRIIQNTIMYEEASPQQLSYLQSIGFGGLWRFAGPFTKTNQNQDNAELFVNCLEAMVETCLPGDDLDVQNPYPSSLGIASNLNLSSSMSSLSMGSLHSPTDKDCSDITCSALTNGNRMRHGSASHVQPKCRVGSFKRKNSKKKQPETFE